MDIAWHHNKQFCDGKGLKRGTAVPTIMLESEYKWFTQHSRALFDMWCVEACKKKYGSETLDAEALVKALPETF
jgi:hypothetical protein